MNGATCTGCGKPFRLPPKRWGISFEVRSRVVFSSLAEERRRLALRSEKFFVPPANDSIDWMCLACWREHVRKTLKAPASDASSTDER